MASLPYAPSTAFLSNRRGKDLIYIFQPTNEDPATVQLVSLNASDSLHTTNISTITITENLPFLTDNLTSYTALADSEGDIFAYAGNCKDTAGQSTLWSFAPTKDDIRGVWTKRILSPSSTNETDHNGKARCLAAGMTFSTTVNATSDIYIFGGMCPSNRTASSAEDWQAGADYFNSLLSLQSQSSPSENLQLPGYDLTIQSSRSPPIPEAGFTVTPLKPTFFNSSDGNTSKQQNFVLLGGHTKEAFINMSQVALFSLPEQSWAFLPVNAPTSTTKTDLTVRDNNKVDPRSGHTAVLTTDGQHVVIFGGWVGDVNTPAEPQLAILELGQGFGGTGEWMWTIPDGKGNVPVTGSGIYGHGAVMLPGEVMMVVGGYLTSDFTATHSKRAASRISSSYFYNVSSSTWTDSYTNPAVAMSQEASAGSSLGAGGLTSKKAGLGAGLAFGLAAIIGALVLYLCHTRRRKRRREARDKELRDLAKVAERFHSLALGHGGVDGRGADRSAVEWMQERHQNLEDAYPWAPRDNGGTDAERTGLLVEIPSPTRGLRRSLHSRGPHQQPSRYDDRRRSRGSGHIHPIDERDEYNEGVPPLNPEMKQRTNGNILGTAPVLDPFRDPAPLASHPVGVSRTPSPQSPAREREMEVRNWVSDWTAADALMHQHAGRISPDKSDRTSSTLSELSTLSAFSIHSNQQSIGTLGRSVSQRSTGLFSSNFSPPDNHTTSATPILATLGRGELSRGKNQPNRRSQSLTLNTVPSRFRTSDLVPFTAVSFPRLRSEGEALLGGFSEQGERSPVRTQSRAKGWMGSMRRALTGSDGSTSTSPENGDHSSSSSPTKYQYTDTDVPRRAASTGTMLWRKRQGAKDWDVEDYHRREEVQAAESSANEDHEEWDVESAVERRVVQVMFTVPKEKLRIVNGAPDADEESIGGREQDIVERDAK
ncbi:MAG: hypothetical protein Q9187_002920 [Circinaria calcarea]